MHPMTRNSTPRRCWAALMLAGCAWLSGCTGAAAPALSSTLFRCDRNGSQEERVACP